CTEQSKMKLFQTYLTYLCSAICCADAAVIVAAGYYTEGVQR
uniref:Uncharacterized protein n=1 Tax=Parascaris univalens TaxID=6257 RepID=A0A914ZM63_PARUN